ARTHYGVRDRSGRRGPAARDGRARGRRRLLPDLRCEPDRNLAPPGSGHVRGFGLLANANAITVGSTPTVKVLGLTINIYDVIAAVVAGLIVIGLGLAIRARITTGVPGRMQLAFETISEAVGNQVESSIGEKGR